MAIRLKVSLSNVTVARKIHNLVWLNKHRMATDLLALVVSQIVMRIFMDEMSTHINF